MVKTMYPAINNSPQTALTAGISATAALIPIGSIASFPAAPNIATIGAAEDAELIQYNGIEGSTLTGCVRGFNGTTARIWPAESLIGRYLSAYDQNTLNENVEAAQENIQRLNVGKADIAHTHSEYLTAETDPTVPPWAKAAAKPAYTAAEVGAAASGHTHSEYLTAETDPTVPAWAKAAAKPAYTAAEVGAAASGHTHSEYLTAETDPTVPAWAKAAAKPAYTAAEVGALPLAGGNLTGTVTAHNGTDYTVYRCRNIGLSTVAATPANGDLLGVYS